MSEAEQKQIEVFFNQHKLKNYNYTEASSVGLYYLLPQMDWHISENSTVISEAAQFNVSSIITHTSGADLFENLIQSKMAVYTESKSEIIKKIKEGSSLGNQNEVNFGADEFENKLKLILS